MNKYCLTPIRKIIDGHTLYRIRAVKDFSNIKHGNYGGFIENELNLSHNGLSWVGDEACVFDNACVCDNAQVLGDACVSGNVDIYGESRVLGHACVSGNVDIYGNAKVDGSAVLNGDIEVYGNTIISENATLSISCRVKDDAKVMGNSYISGGAVISGNAIIMGNSIINGDFEIGDNTVANNVEYISNTKISTPIETNFKLKPIQCDYFELCLGNNTRWTNLYRIFKYIGYNCERVQFERDCITITGITTPSRFDLISFALSNGFELKAFHYYEQYDKGYTYVFTRKRINNNNVL